MDEDEVIAYLAALDAGFDEVDTAFTELWDTIDPEEDGYPDTGEGSAEDLVDFIPEEFDFEVDQIENEMANDGLNDYDFEAYMNYGDNDVIPDPIMSAEEIADANSLPPSEDTITGDDSAPSTDEDELTDADINLLFDLTPEEEEQEAQTVSNWFQWPNDRFKAI